MVNTAGCIVQKKEKDSSVSNKHTMDLEHILSVLPHAHPFVLIDRVLDYEPGISVHAIKNVTYHEPFFKGHFPEKAVMPGALIIEAMAQAAGALSLTAVQDLNAKDLFLLAGIDKARFKKMVIPGDQLHLYCRVVKARRNLARFHCEAKVDGQLCVGAELLLIREPS
jgi:3-hydroxyacyl-[acyl-carrier-protein] dehydratase